MAGLKEGKPGPAPCPFCGSGETGPDNLAGLKKTLYKIRCGECRAGSFLFETADEALAAWNRRSGAGGGASPGDRALWERLLAKGAGRGHGGD